MIEENDLIVIGNTEAGQRLDKILAQRFGEVYSRTYFQKLIDEERVLLNGELVKKRTKPLAGDEIEIEFLLTPELDLSPEPIPLDILYEDGDLIAVNKPAGMVVHPAVGNWSGTFVNALLYHCRLDYEQGNQRPGIVHRLDKDTTGLLLAAKNPLAQQRLIAQFASRQVHKEYLAICIGNPEQKLIIAPIGRHPQNRKLMAVLEVGGKKAISRCQTLAFDGTLSLVKIILETGRTHQIRVHMKYIGNPVLGDDVYGRPPLNKKYKAQRQLLHAHRLKFKHPITDKVLELEAPLPEDMRKYKTLLPHHPFTHVGNQKPGGKPQRKDN